MSALNHTTPYAHPEVSSQCLNADNILFYFCDSNNPFYERSCDNETLRMQGRPMSNLTQMTGIQYAVESDRPPPLYVIRKHKRNSPIDYTPISYYYIINGVIQECPSVFTTVQTRLANAVSSLTHAMTDTLGMLTVSAVEGRKWNFKTKPARSRIDPSENEANTPTDLNNPSANAHLSHSRLPEATDPLHERSTLFQTLHTERILQSIMQRFPPKMKIPLPDEQTQPTMTTVPVQQNWEMADESATSARSIPAPEQMLMGGFQSGELPTLRPIIGSADKTVLKR